MPARDQHLGDLLRVALIHLASVGFDVDPCHCDRVSGYTTVNLASRVEKVLPRSQELESSNQEARA
jgi:hypothetical protein